METFAETLSLLLSNDHVLAAPRAVTGSQGQGGSRGPVTITTGCSLEI